METKEDVQFEKELEKNGWKKTKLGITTVYVKDITEEPKSDITEETKPTTK